MELLVPVVFLIPLAFLGALLGVWIWALVDALQVPADIFYRSGAKVIWAVLIGVMGPIAAVVYLAVGRPDRATREWIAAQQAAGVDLRVYRVYDQGVARPQPPWPSQPTPPSPPPGWGPAPPPWPPGDPGRQGGAPPGYPPGPPHAPGS
ncbi:hypothetical protein [Euzebya sp.]|uniref:hypothetical protein n=1 Tax=Euzebya sp. TaxID=1971409 RepID=UPI00351217D6